MRALSLAIRNLLRNRRRSLATLLAMAIGATSILVFGGYSKNLEYTMQSVYVRSGGHLQIQQRDFYLYGSGNPTAYGIADYDKIAAAIQADAALRGMVRVATPTLQFGGIASNYEAGVSRTILGVGLVATDYQRMREWNDFDLPQNPTPFPLVATAADAAIVGTGVARVLQLCGALKMSNCPESQAQPSSQGQALPDDLAQLSLQETSAASGAASAHPGRIELLASSARGAPNVASVDVIRAEPQAFKELDDVSVTLHLQQAQRLIYGTARPKVTSIMVQLQHTSQVAVAQARLVSLLARVSPGQPLTVLDFRSLNPFYVQSQQLFDTIFGFIYCLIGGIVLFTVGNTMNMAVVERTVEIGTLRAIGLRRSGIRRMFLLEGFLLGLFGAVVGVVCALATSFIINHSGLTWLPPGSAQYLPLTLRIWGEGRMMLFTTLGLMVVATLSAWWPAYRAAKMVVVDALRHA